MRQLVYPPRETPCICYPDAFAGFDSLYVDYRANQSFQKTLWCQLNWTRALACYWIIKRDRSQVTELLKCLSRTLCAHGSVPAIDTESLMRVEKIRNIKCTILSAQFWVYRVRGRVAEIDCYELWSAKTKMNWQSRIAKQVIELLCEQIASYCQ